MWGHCDSNDPTSLLGGERPHWICIICLSDTCVLTPFVLIRLDFALLAAFLQKQPIYLTKSRAWPNLSAMLDYPETLPELIRRFSTEEACLNYIRRLRWPEGFVCPRCGQRRGRRVRNTLIECATCSHQTSATAGTLFHRTRYSLRTWFHVLWFISQKRGTSALDLQRYVGLRSYKTAWAWMHKLRRSLASIEEEPLAGQVEICATRVSAARREEVIGWRRTEQRRPLVMIAASARAFGSDRAQIRLRQIGDRRPASWVPIASELVEPGSVLGFASWEDEFRRLNQDESIPYGSNYGLCSAVAPALRLWLIETHRGAVSHEHLDCYLGEFSFRYNRYDEKDCGKLFYHLLERAVAASPLTFQQLRKNVTRTRLNRSSREET